MLVPLRYFLWAVSKLFVSLRYRVRVRGLEQIRGLKGPVLVLPNHPGLVDPLLVLAAVWPSLKPRPMVYEGNFNNPFMRLLMKVLNAVRVPTLTQASAKAHSRARKAVEVVIAGLNEGANHVLWPSGHIQHDGMERLGGARALADILQAAPEAAVVLVRTRGLWGSMFGYAQTGEHPHLIGRYAAGLGWLAANLFLFTPRRKVDITIEHVERDRLPELRRETLNPWLEAWYNDNNGPETPTYVPYHFLFGRRSFEFPKPRSLAEVDPARIKPEVRETIAHMIADKLGRPLSEDEQKPDTTFDQLGLDSLDRMELNLHVEQQYGFTSDQVPTTLGQLWALAQGLIERGPPKPAPPGWFAPPSDDGPLEILGDTIAAAFVARAQRNPREVAVADDMAGVLTYERLLTAALAMSRRFAALPAANVGLMMPASVACDIALLALQLAGKLPVILNWTTGPANLAHAARVMGLTHVVTSRAFIDRTAIEVEGVEYLYLETLRKDMSKFELLRTLLTVRWLPGRVRKQVPHTTPDQPAVVLFTSGSEKAPKAVPLTHQNILTNHRTGAPFLGLTRRDAILGFLPAFHSFGMSVTCLLPLMGGMRVVHHPDPTDASGLARKVGAYRPTFLVGTPTFVSYILERAEREQLTSLRLIVVGAEACPPSVRQRCAELAPAATLLEGYGITECSPVVSCNTVNANRPGTLGKPLPGVEVCVVDLDTDEVLPTNRLGMLLVSGPTVFPGYIAYDGPTPFQERDGKRWYITGDLVRIDDDGFIHFGGRLKRFLKAGGEMISLPALEEPFVRLYPPTQDGPRVAVEGVETESGRRIVLFTTEPMNLRDANARLLEGGFRGVMRLDEVRQVECIPVLGTGKTDYKALRAMIQKSHHESHESKDKKSTVSQ
ncbi:MAG TPA: AMP-binding protein [Gemmataceae bacterium]|jgi:long-chain-fatty-acid--[acyl-carrier-protein] ligase